MANVLARMGNIFEGGVDLTVLPCSAKGTVSSATKTWLGVFAIPDPMSLAAHPRLGQVSELIEFPGNKDVTKFVVFAAAVLNDFADTASLEKIGAALGRITRDRAEIAVVECPLLGTGAGGLSAVDSARSLCAGFVTSCADDATLYIFAFDAERLRDIQSAIKPSNVLGRVWDSVSLKPGVAGVSVDLKQLIKKKP